MRAYSLEGLKLRRARFLIRAGLAGALKKTIYSSILSHAGAGPAGI
jgi:hypothetical protein